MWSHNRDLVSVLNLGYQDLTGVFPKSADEPVTSGPLELVWSPDSGLLQLAHSFDAAEMYGDNYGYRSGLNGSMVRHLTAKIRMLEQTYGVKPATRSSTSVRMIRHPCEPIRRPVWTVLASTRLAEVQILLPDDIALIPDFFSAEAFRKAGRRSQSRYITRYVLRS